MADRAKTRRCSIYTRKSTEEGLDQAVTDSTTVNLPWGDTLAAVLVGLKTTLTVALLTVLTTAVAKLPGWIKPFIGKALTDQLLNRAIDYAINTTSGAVKGEVLQINVGSQVVARALEYAFNHGAGWLLTWMGDKDMVKEKLIARLDVAKDVALR